MPRPRGGDWLDDEIQALAGQQVNALVSFLGPFEAAELDLLGEEEACQQSGIEFLSFPVSDRSLPSSSDDARQFVYDLATRIEGGQSLVLHCRLGIGRAGMFSAAVLILLGETAQTAMERVSAARGLEIPDTQEQVAWLHSLERDVRTS